MHVYLYAQMMRFVLQKRKNIDNWKILHTVYVVIIINESHNNNEKRVHVKLHNQNAA